MYVIISPVSTERSAPDHSLDIAVVTEYAYLDKVRKY
jgi:hypothetical protein